ncbi:MAG: ABC transporter ATP-binding protein [Verrucomicrobiales bacterium]|nr:ABC transporter ATP-binding protein [Verrucomicrobiales bacterium]
MNAHLEISALSKTFATPKGPLVVVRDFELRMAKGEFVCLIGHSGCGKSTVLSMVAGLSDPDPAAGGIVLAGRELRGPGPDRGVVFQSPSLLPWLSAFDNVLLGVDQVFYTASATERRQIVEYYLTVVGLADAMHKLPAELSQGMRQRVGIARAFALSPRMLLLDEPFGMLDSLTRMELQQVLVDLWTRNHLSALMVTHDVDEALFLADRIVLMTNGPEARVGDILAVPFARPRDRKSLLEDPEYYRLRSELIEFLEVRAYTLRGQSPPVAPEPPASGTPLPPTRRVPTPSSPSNPEPNPVPLSVG